MDSNDKIQEPETTEETTQVASEEAHEINAEEETEEAVEASDEEMTASEEEAEEADDIIAEIEEAAEAVEEQAEEIVNEVAEEVEEAVEAIEEQTETTFDAVEEEVEEITDDVDEPVDELEETAETVEDEVGETVDEVAEEVEETTDEVVETTEAAVEEPIAVAEETLGDPEAIPTEAPDAETSDEDLFLAAMSEDSDGDGDDFMFKTLKKREIVEGSIAKLSRDEVLVDVGAKTEGVIANRELDALDDEWFEQHEEGDTIKVFVITPEDKQGNILLSIRRAKEAEDWEMAVEYLEEEKIYEGNISGFNKGGLLVRFGMLRGFIPASQISNRRRQRADGNTPSEQFGEMVGEEINVKVIEVNRERNRLILSERAAVREIREEMRDELLDELQKGQVREGFVTSLTDFGAFVDLGGIDGLIHISELAWKPVKHPRDVLEVGEEVEVEVISVDRDRQRIGLSRKSQLADPWRQLEDNYQPEQLVQGKVTKLTNFGAFARLVDMPSIEGLIHISELSDRRVGHPKEVVSEGDVLTLRILRIEPERRRLGLSLKRVAAEDYIQDDMGGDWRSMLDDLNEE